MVNRKEKEDIEDVKKQIYDLQNKYKNLQKKFEDLTIEIKEIKEIKNNKKNININKSKTKKDPNSPKKNSNAYIHFCNEYRKNHPNEKNVLKMASKEWKNIKDDPKQRERFDIMAKEDKERYENEINN